MRLAASRTFCTAGRSSPIRIAMIAITTKISISVNPRRGVVFMSMNMAATCCNGRGAAAGRHLIRLASDSLPLGLYFQFRHVPHLHRLIAASRDQESAVGAERHADDEAGVTAEGADQLSGIAVPDFHRAVLPGGGDPPAIVVGTERQGVDLPAVSLRAVPPEG